MAAALMSGPLRPANMWSAGDRISKIIIPAALPRIFLAFRLAAGIALIVAVTVEIAINPMEWCVRAFLNGQVFKSRSE